MKDYYKCSHVGCSKVYVNSAILKRHVQAFHSPMNKFQCSVCKKLLASRQNLKEHSYIHSGEKPYACKEPGCFLSFRQGTHLSAHKKTHMVQYNSIENEYLTKKISEMAFADEKHIFSMEIFLPILQEEISVPVLPSIF